jgi:hypothetical protein
MCLGDARNALRRRVTFGSRNADLLRCGSPRASGSKKPFAGCRSQREAVCEFRGISGGLGRGFQVSQAYTKRGKATRLKRCFLLCNLITYIYEM